MSSDLNERYFEIRKKAKKKPNTMFNRRRVIIYIVVIFLLVLVKLYFFNEEKEKEKINNTITPLDLLYSPELVKVNNDSIFKFSDFQFFAPKGYNYLLKNEIKTIYNDSMTVSFLIGKNIHGKNILMKYQTELKKESETIIFDKSQINDNVYDFKITKNGEIKSNGRLKLINSAISKENYFMFLVIDPKFTNDEEIMKIVESFK
jgi:hypothetical protein